VRITKVWGRRPEWVIAKKVMADEKTTDQETTDEEII
jgi:hypothetical protein